MGKRRRRALNFLGAPTSLNYEVDYELQDDVEKDDKDDDLDEEDENDDEATEAESAFDSLLAHLGWKKDEMVDE